MKNSDVHISSQIQKAHSFGSLLTLISFVLNVFASRIKELELLIVPLIIIVFLTISGSSYYFYLSMKHKERIDNPVKNNIAFIFRIGINLVLLALMVI